MRTLNPEYVEKIAAVTNSCPYFSLLSMKIREIRIGRSLLQVDLAGKHLQPFGIVHGGVVSSLLDAAAFWAVWAEADETAGMTSVDLKINFLAPARTGILTAKGRRIKLGRTIGLGHAEITDEGGRVVAEGTSTLMVLPNMGLHDMYSLPPKFLD